MDPWELEMIPNEKMQKLIDNCLALDLDPDLIDKSYIYQTPEKKYSQIWTKEDIHDDEPIYYYYRIQIVGLRKNGYDEEGNYYFTENWGAFDTINHRKRSAYLPLTQCLQKFMIQSNERMRNNIFARIKENDISKYPLPESVQELIAKYIFEINFLERMKTEYTFDVKRRISDILPCSTVLQNGNQWSNYPSNLVRHTPVASSMAYQQALELLSKTIPCELTDKKENKEKKFTLMNFYYKQLHTTINVVDKNSDRYKIIEKYFHNSNSSKHSYGQIYLKNVFEIERPCDDHRYTKHLNNKQLLWHGTSTSNIPFILYEGFRTTKASIGGMFGAGTYFANSVSKSLGYCRTTGECVLLLCEVALGDTIRCSHSNRNLLNAEGILANGKNSVHGFGTRTPDPSDYVTIDGDVLVPYGTLMANSTHQGAALVHDEFIVYNPAQIKMRYLITMSFE